MTAVQFKVSRVSQPDRYKSIFLFNSPNHLKTQSRTGWWRYCMVQFGKEIATIHFNIQKRVASSPLRAPFGGLEIASPDIVSDEQLQLFFDFILNDCKEKRVSEIQLKNFPTAYDETISLRLHQALLQAGFKYTKEVASMLAVDAQPLSVKMSPSKRQKLKKSKSYLTFQKESLKDITRVYRFLEFCRKERGHQLSLTLRNVSTLAKEFPKNLLLFSAYEKQELASASIVIAVSKQIWYTFYYGHAKQFDKMNPTVFLLDGIYHYAQLHHCKIIDLGTSMSGSEVNQSLLHFKTSIGAYATPKFSYRKLL